MEQATSRGGRVIGEYLVGRQLGSGSFSLVWHGRHRVHGTEVAIKEIAMDRLNKKLQESLRSEIVILKQITHPNIIRLHEIIEVPGNGRVYLVLEYCRGGDLYKYLQKRGRVSEKIAKQFMIQLAAGLQVLRENNIIHRDLKPQNLLLSSNDDMSVLKIADFGFARSLQETGLAETLCGSPLYMAPEIMQMQKYDAKADLWSVGAIQFQLVSGITPFTGNNQMQLLQNILKSAEVHFPPDITDLSSECVDLCKKLLRRNPVERLTFDEFFNHPFLSQKQPDDMYRTGDLQAAEEVFLLPESAPSRSTEGSSPDDCMPFLLDDDSSGPDGSPSHFRRSSLQTYRCSPESRKDLVSASRKNTDLLFKHSNVKANVQNTGSGIGRNRWAESNNKASNTQINHRPCSSQAKARDVDNVIDQDYVLVSGPLLDVPSSSVGTSKLKRFPGKQESSSQMPMMNVSARHLCPIGSMDSQYSDPSRTSFESTAYVVSSEQQSNSPVVRIKSLQQCAAAIKELVEKKMRERRYLEAFSVELVILAIWKLALNICHTQAVSTMEGSPSQGIDRPGVRADKMRGSHDLNESHDDLGNSRDIEDISLEIEKEFFAEVGIAEELSRFIEPGNVAMPDAMETIYQSALALGKNGAVDELIGNVENASSAYSKAVQLLVFLLVEAPSLMLNPPFSLTNAARFRLRTYISVLSDRQGHSRSQRMALLKPDVSTV